MAPQTFPAPISGDSNTVLPGTWTKILITHTPHLIRLQILLNSKYIYRILPFLITPSTSLAWIIAVASQLLSVSAFVPSVCS